MSADKDKWMEELRHKFDNYEELASENLWKSIERDVNAIDMKRRMRRFMSMALTSRSMDFHRFSLASSS